MSLNSLSTFWRTPRSFQIDRAVTFAVLGNFASLMFGPVTAFLIATRFSPELQGYYYTFGSLLMVQFLLDLGFGQAIIQFASHEWAKLSVNSAGRIVGTPDALSRLISLGHMSCKWYGLCAVLLVMALGPVGYFFFSAAPKSGIQWTFPWFALCIAIPLQFALMPAFYLLQGCNQVTSFWFYRLIQRIINDLSLWAAILLGAKLWAGSIAVSCGIIWSCYFLWRWHCGFVLSFLNRPHGSLISWRADVWPLQWRMGISWVSAYLTTSLFSPILFQLSGPVVAGQIGMTASLNNVLHGLSANWVVTKAPHFGILVAQKEYRELDRLFSKSFFSSMFVAFAGALGMWLLIYVLYYIRHPLGFRILSPLPTALFLIATIFNSTTTSLSIYLRAHKTEPLSGIYLITGCVIALSTYLLGSQFGEIGVTAAYLAAVAFLQFPISLIIFSRCRTQLHS